MINVTKTHLPSIEKYKAYIDEIYSSGWLTNNGQFVRKLEEKLKEYLGVKYIVLVSNGTLALQIAYKALELEGEVITTPFTFVATTSSLVWQGLTPKFVDIDRDTFNIDYRKIEESITEKTSAIVPVHVFGNACEIERISTIAKKHKLKVIYDAAHAFGVKYKDKNILNFGDISTISFHSTKLFHTIEGGAIVVNSKEMYDKVKLLINFGIPGTDQITGVGINSKMNEFEAAMGLCMLDDLEKIHNKRKIVFNYYMDNLPNGLEYQKINDDCTANYAYFPVLFKSEELLLKVIKNLNSRDIFPRRYFYPSLETLDYIENSFDISTSSDISKRILCLPMYDTLSIEDLRLITSIIKESLQ
ncbi:DegT/DnrJ/EryC1/StrS family aminotransferase [Clostridium sp. 19966]|uniref:DegT/DnrJ/EryC1/StrS family aminotransferase n=1 Tax=Clostridium sp. 19966 TaxID=2768166 RepID=UPI0028DEC46C|nr:DegT/DnrJ/EryC1/StrS family aminotransferase [Clostridium sp. 19966]MDT8716143.1 DegT/DnrJ/EryC1/StrS family aminotransferase [Clostridium sp. 19966]